MVGEPSSSKTLGDVVRMVVVVRLRATLYIQGIQGHVAYPHFSGNPYSQSSAVLTGINHISMG